MGVAALLAVVSAVAVTQVPVDSGADTLVERDSASFRASERIRERFGEETVVVLARGDLPELIMTENLGQLLRLEGCLSGRVPRGAKPLPGPCAELARLDPVLSLAGPATFLNGAVIQLEGQLRRLAAGAPPARLREILVSVAARYGITSAPSLTNPDFIAAVVFDLRRARATPKSRLAYLFPNDRSAQILIRLRPDLSEAQRSRAHDLIRAAVAEETPRAACGTAAEPAPCFALRDGSYLVSGVPIVVEEVAPALRTALLILLAVAVLVMAVTLILVFATRPRLLPLAVALAAVALTFGLFAAAGGALTVASIAVLPILIGLAVDYAIQLQARFGEAAAAGRVGAEAARAAAAAGGPTIALACLATTAGFAALQLSPTPMVRDFGLLLTVGVPLSFPLALSAGLAGLVLAGPAAGRAADGPGGGGRLGRALEATVGFAVGRPRGVLAAGVVLAALGWGLATQVETVSDVRQLGPSGLDALRDLGRLQDATGVSGRLDAIVEAPDLTDPAVLGWMDSFKRRALRAGGYAGERPSCLEAELCPGPAISDFVAAGGDRIGRRAARATFRALPRDDLRQLATLDPDSGLPAGSALLSFGIRAQSLARQGELIERVRDEIGEPGSPGGPPAGVEVELGGLPVIAAEAAADLDRSRLPLTLAGLLAVALVLLVALRSPRRALLPLVPVALASGWSGLVIWLTGVSLDPMSAAFGALTVAIATEFAVILAGRFEAERAAAGAVAALRTAYTRTGPAVVASAATVIAGFAVLLASDIEMLRNFGLVTVIDLGVALLGVLVVLPAVLALPGEGTGS